MSWIYLLPAYADLCPPRTVVETSIADALVELWRRDAREEHKINFQEPSRIPTKEAQLDLGGMATTHRKIYALEPFDGLQIQVPAKDVEDYLYILDKRSDREPEEIAGKKFYTLPSFRVGVLLSLEQCEALHERLSKILVEASAIASIENGAFNEFMSTKKHVVAPPRPTKKIEEA